jgi:hypothetical protein
MGFKHTGGRVEKKIQKCFNFPRANGAVRLCSVFAGFFAIAKLENYYLKNFQGFIYKPTDIQSLPFVLLF